MCDAGYSGQTVKIVKQLREKFDLAPSDHNSPFAHPVCCMDPLRLTVHKIYSQHAPTKLTRVDGILSKHEGHGQLLLCALICKYNSSLVSVLSVLEGKSSGVPIGTGPPSLPLSCSCPNGNGSTKEYCQQAAIINVNERKKIYMMQNLVSLVQIGGIWMRGDAGLIDYGASTLGGNECGTEPGSDDVDDDKGDLVRHTSIQEVFAISFTRSPMQFVNVVFFVLLWLAPSFGGGD